MMGVSPSSMHRYAVESTTLASISYAADGIPRRHPQQVRFSTRCRPKGRPKPKKTKWHWAIPPALQFVQLLLRRDGQQVQGVGGVVYEEEAFVRGRKPEERSASGRRSAFVEQHARNLRAAGSSFHKQPVIAVYRKNVAIARTHCEAQRIVETGAPGDRHPNTCGRSPAGGIGYRGNPVLQAVGDIQRSVGSQTE